MGIGVSILLIAVGAVLAFAVNLGTVAGGAVSVHLVGYILLAVGLFGALLSAMFWSSWGGPGAMRRPPYNRL